jgi:hypothetical protein
VPAAGFEPARTFVQRLAGPPRLPFSPRRHNRLRTAAIPKAKTRDPAKCCRPRATIRRPTEVVVIEKTHASARSNRSGGRNPDQGDLRFLGLRVVGVPDPGRLEVPRALRALGMTARASLELKEGGGSCRGPRSPRCGEGTKGACHSEVQSTRGVRFLAAVSKNQIPRAPRCARGRSG